MIATYEKTIFKDESSGYCICSFPDQRRNGSGSRPQLLLP